MVASSPTWLAAGSYSLADVAAAPFVARIAEIEPAALADAAHPRVQRWWQRMQERPAFAEARLQRFGEVLEARQNTPAAGAIANALN